MKFHMNEYGFQSKLEFGELKISGNEERGFRPYELWVSSVAACSGGWLRYVLQKMMRIEFSDIAITAKTKRNPKWANRIESIHLTYIITGKDITPEKMEKALAITRKNCAMIQSIQDSINVTETFEIN